MPVPGCGSRSRKKNSIDRGAFCAERAHGRIEAAFPSTLDGDRLMNEANIFAAALEKSSLEEREAFLAQACAGDEKIRRRVEALLRAHNEPDDLLDEPAGGELAVTYVPLTESPGTEI